MLLVKKCDFFHYLFSLKIRLEVRFNNVLERKKIFSDCKNKINHTLKNHIFPKGLTHAFGQKMQFFFHYLFSLKLRVEERVNNVLETKKNFFGL